MNSKIVELYNINSDLHNSVMTKIFDLKEFEEIEIVMQTINRAKQSLEK
ncbi:MAG: hypothetical protein LBM96_10890 [Methanobrevibacter sp.]|nr:hypothetical protein [Candidatus Methanoflexus mossambicus]